MIFALASNHPATVILRDGSLQVLSEADSWQVGCRCIPGAGWRTARGTTTPAGPPWSTSRAGAAPGAPGTGSSRSGVTCHASRCAVSRVSCRQSYPRHGRERVRGGRGGGRPQQGRVLGRQQLGGQHRQHQPEGGRGGGRVLVMTSDHVISQWLVLNGAWNDDWGQVDGARNALEDVIDSLLCNEPEPHTTDPPPPPTTQHPPGTAAQIYRWQAPPWYNDNIDLFNVVQPPDLDVPARAQQQRQPRGLHQRGHRRVRRLGQAEVAPVQQGRDHPPPLRQVIGGGWSRDHSAHLWLARQVSRRGR